MTGPTEDDAALMLRLAAGEDLALNEIMARWQSRLASFLLRITGDHSTALDLTQETFVRLYQSRHRYHPTAAFSTYLFHIAANLARDHARWKRRHPTIPLHPEEATSSHPHPEPASPAPAPDNQAHLRDQLTSLEQALSRLPSPAREALLLSSVEGLPHREIATILHLSPKSVELHIYRARQALRDALPHRD